MGVCRTRKTRVLALASGGGHWVQLLRLRPAFENCNVHYATVDASAASDVAPARFWTFPDSNRDTKVRLALTAARVGWIILRVRPDVIVTTGAAPGYFAIRWGRMFGIRGMFIDSLANAQELSLSARLARRHADRLLTQWPSLAGRFGAEHRGSVL